MTVLTFMFFFHYGLLSNIISRMCVKLRKMSMENLLLQPLNSSVIDFKRCKQTPCSDRSATHLHFKPGYTACPTAHCCSASLPPTGFIWGEGASHSWEGKGDRERERDQEEGKSYCTCVQSCLVDGAARKHLTDGKECHIPAKYALIQTHAAPLPTWAILGLPQIYFICLHATHPRFSSHLLETD